MRPLTDDELDEVIKFATTLGFDVTAHDSGVVEFHGKISHNVVEVTYHPHGWHPMKPKVTITWIAPDESEELPELNDFLVDLTDARQIMVKMILMMGGEI